MTSVWLILMETATKKKPYHGEDRLGAGELEKNLYKKGIVLFEVPQTAKNLVLYYDFNGKRVSWKID